MHNNPQDIKIAQNFDTWEAANNRKNGSLFNRPFIIAKQRKPEAAIVGALGECVVEKWCYDNELEYYSHSQIDSDMVVNNLSTEIKTKVRTVAPLAHYDASVNTYGEWIQKPEIFIFVSLIVEGDRMDIWSYKTAYICGWITSNALTDVGRQIKIGDHDSRNDKTFEAESINIEYKSLMTMNSLVNLPNCFTA